MTGEVKDPGFLKLSVQRALLGNVTENLAGIHAQASDDCVVVSAFFFEEPSEQDKESVEDASAEVIADFPAGYTVETIYGLVSEMDTTRPGWCFLRPEVQSDRT